MKNAMLKKGLAVLGLLLMLGVSMAAYGFSRASERADCPGTIVCPQTGEEICKDRCPLVDADRPDCPGKIECAATGELICRDQCPLGSGDEKTDASQQLPACCRGK